MEAKAGFELMLSPIPIFNLYYLLCYAWGRLDQGAIIDVGSVDGVEHVNLFARILCNGVKRLRKLGLNRGYSTQAGEISGIKGRLELSVSLRRSLFHRGLAVCTFDELTTNTQSNQIIKATLKCIRFAENLDRTLQREIDGELAYFKNVSDVPLTGNSFRGVRASSNAAFYQFMLNVCELVYETQIPTEGGSNTRFRDFTRDDKKMAMLFQSFVSNFISRECRKWKVAAENIAWNAESDTDRGLALLPRMTTDISIRSGSEYWIVDAKYYRQTLTSRFDVAKISSENLYQLSSYLLHAEKGGERPNGMLIYPRVDRDLREEYRMLGRTLRICTVDLNAPWRSIDKELKDLFA